jgi:hypothetical protein
MSRTHNQARTFALLTLPVFLFALLPPVLSIDVVTRLLADAAFQDKGNLALLVLYESTRALICLLGLGFAALLVLRRAEQPDARQLVWFLLFGVIAYAYVALGGGYVGPFQEWLTFTLMACGFSRPALYLLFGYPNWAAWLALGGLVRFSLLYPEPLSEESITASGAEDRAGMMRSVPGAGLDVGHAARDFVVAAHQRGLLGSAQVWLVCAAGAVLSLVLASSRLNLLLWLPYLALFTVALTALRASFVAGEPDTRQRIRVVGRSAAAGVLLFVLSALVGMSEGTVTEIASFILVTMAPLAVLIGFAVALLPAARVDLPAPAAHAGAP